MKASEIYKVLLNLKKRGGATFKHYQPISYDSGYQVARDDSYMAYNWVILSHEEEEVIKFINKCKGSVGLYKGDDGCYYVDRSFWVATRELAEKIGRENNQESIFQWCNGETIMLR